MIANGHNNKHVKWIDYVLYKMTFVAKNSYNSVKDFEYLTYLYQLHVKKNLFWHLGVKAQCLNTWRF